ncbi:MAG: zinc ribbon domain-containing protein [Treponema sp.]|nr:zinc ribbon domain-containing protein [Treponema sp.]
MKEKPRFYCDNCGSEVPQDARGCPECGRSFGSVRCPVCGFTGDVEIFESGCPGCGYSNQSDIKDKPSKPKIPKTPAPKKQNPSEGAFSHTLPFWVYIVTGIVFVVVLIMLYFSVVSA